MDSARDRGARHSLTGCTWLLCTHGHTDRIDALTIDGFRRAARPQLLVPRAEALKARARGVDPEALRTIGAGECLDVGTGINVAAVASAQEELEADAGGRRRFLG